MSRACTGPALRHADAKHGLLDVVGERQRERLEVADDLVDVFDDARDGLVLVHDAVDAEAPDGGAAERRQQHAAHRVAERVAEAALERLEPELGDVRVVFALRRFDDAAGRNESRSEIDGHGRYFE